MAKREYVEANKRWLEEKAREEGVQALPRGIYYKVLKEGNPDGAKPEKGDTWTLGYGTKFNDKTDVNISYFQSNLEDAIRWYSTNPADWSVPWHPTNIDKQKKKIAPTNFKSTYLQRWGMASSHSQASPVALPLFSR